MSFGIRGKLVVISLCILTICGTVSGIYLEGVLRGWFGQKIERDLNSYATAIVASLEELPNLKAGGTVHAYAHRMGKAIGARVSIIGDDGVVLGDSELTTASLLVVENHASRPEILEALKNGTGKSTRYSTTVDKELSYVAHRFQYREDQVGVVRVAMPRVLIDSVTQRMRRWVIVAGIIGMIIAVFMSSLASYYFSKQLRNLVKSAQSLVTGKEFIPVRGQDEFGVIAQSMNRMAGELEGLLGELGTERDRFQSVLEGMDNAVLAVDKEKRVIFANRATQEVLRLSEDPTNKFLLDIIEMPQLIELIRAEDSEQEGYAEFKLPDTNRTILVKFTRGVSADILLIHDMTRLRKLEIVRRDFVANVSHELRTPIAVIQANAETLLDGALQEPPQAERFVDGILRNAKRLSNLISDLLDLTRIESGKYEVEAEEIVLSRLIKRVWNIVEVRAQQRNIELKSMVASDTLVIADIKALEQIMVNYLDNAIKYGPENATIEVRLRNIGVYWRIEVADEGAGIEAKHHERLFERFYRVDKGRSRYMGGTGLGLAIVKHLAAAMGGWVGVSSAKRGGTVFWVELPKSSFLSTDV